MIFFVILTSWCTPKLVPNYFSELVGFVSLAPQTFSVKISRALHPKILEE